MVGPVLNRELTLEGPHKSSDGAGGFSEIWLPLGALWAEVKLRTGRERERESVGTARVEYRITVRAAPEEALSRPRAGQRFRDGGRLFRILAVAEWDRDARYLICFCSEEVAV